jgi:dolichol-phosphate mannosyltransferase
MSDGTLAVSVLVVVSGRADPLDSLYREYAEPLRSAGVSHEFVFVVPSDHPGLLAPLTALRDAGEPIQLFEAAHNVGEAGLLRSAVPHCRGEVILMLAPYRRVTAAALPLLLRAIDEGADLAVARRAATSDPLANRIQRRMVHWLVRLLVGGTFHDLGSGVRAIRRDVIAELPVYGELSRFLPLFAVREGFRVLDVEVPQHHADQQTRVYSPGIYLRRLLDLLAVFFLIRFREKPLRFFGLIGGVVSLAGLITLAMLGAQRLGGRPLADRPMLVVGVLLLVLGVQGVALGLIGEIIVHAGAKRRQVYRLSPPR